jgi:uncharacterized membrane protein YdbT with pleckstrin-like domain
MGYLEDLMGKSEQIVLTTRQHWITIIGALLVNGFFILLLIGIGVTASLLVTSFLGPLGLLVWIPPAVVGVLCLAPLWRLVSDWLHWWNDIYVVTNRRIIQAQGIFNKHVIDSSLEKINDVVLTQSALGRMLGYGDIEILTGSEIGVNLLKRITEPVRFKTEMLNQKEGMGEMDAFESRAKRVLGAAAPSAGDVPELIAELDELRKKGLITDAEFQAKKTKLLSQI